MDRTEKYREIRKEKSRYMACLSIFAVVLAGGIFTADYSLGSLMRNSYGISILHIQYPSADKLEISLMDRSFSLNTRYLHRDLERVKGWLGR